MHPAGHFRETDEAAMRALVAEIGFGLIIGVDGARPLVAHAALLLEGRSLRFHISRVNALTPVLEKGGTALAVVTGADAYVSPDWHGVPDQVPTWNYLSVEMEGPVRPLDDDAAAGLLDDLSAHFEAKLAPKPPWTSAKMTPSRFEGLVRKGIRAFEMSLERFEGVTKLSQNKDDAVMARIIAALGDVEIARLMELKRAPRR
ncbi:MAG TPA: FMN-binding negative transcriptional regulator [Caulobacteraceae bacterium]